MSSTSTVSRRPDQVPVTRAARLPVVGRLLGALAASVLAWAVFVRTVTPLDFDVFVAGGRAVAHGSNPYPAVGSPFVWSGSAFVYPWLTAWVFAPASYLSAHLAALLWTAVSIGSIALGVWALVGLRFVPFACVLFSAPTLDGLQMGTVNALLFLGLCLAWRWREYALRAGLAVGVLVTLKVLCWPLVLWLLVTRRWRAAASAVVTGTVLMGTGWLLGPIGVFDYERILSQLGSHEVTTSSGFQASLVRLSLSPAGAQVIGLACAVAMIAVAARRSDALCFAAAVVSALVASPVVWHHYYLMAAAPLLLVRRGAWWYLLLGWASVAARESYGISWRPLSVLALIALGALVAWHLLSWLLAPVPSRSRPVGLRLRVVAGSAAGIAALTTLNATEPGSLSGSFSIAVSVAVLVLAWFRTGPRRDGATDRATSA